MIYFLRSPEQGQSPEQLQRIWNILWSSLELLWQTKWSAKQSSLQGIFRVRAESLLAKADWALLTKKGSVIPLLESWSYLCTSDFRPWTDSNILKGAQTSKAMSSGSHWAIDLAWGRVLARTADSWGKMGSLAPLFQSETPDAPESLAPFWIVTGKWNWVFPVLLCCVWEIFKWLWVVFGPCFALCG